MNIDSIIQQLSAFRQQYGDLPVALSANGAYTLLTQVPWLAVETIYAGEPAYVVVFGPNRDAAPPFPQPHPIVFQPKE